MKNNNYLNKIKFLVVFCCMAQTIISCKKLIEIPDNPPQLIPNSGVFADSASVMSAVVGVYNNFGVSTQQSIHSGGITLNTGLSGDELQPRVTNSIFTNAILSTDGVIGSLWGTAYTSLYQVNACLEGIPATNGISASLKQQLIGEMEVVRALYYFNLVNLYGPVPLVTTTDYKATQSLPRASVDSIYLQIIADLKDAQQKLKTNYPSAGRARPNLHLANALLAKVYLYRGQWANTEVAANTVISSTTYSLVTDLNKVFLNGSSEAIWQLPALSLGNQTREAALFVPFANNVTPNNRLSASLVNAFVTGDLRLQKWAGRNIITGNTFYYPFKYKNTLATVTPLEDYMIIRLADVYLIRAEALARQNKIVPALADLNIIRNRAREVATGFEYTGLQDQASVLSEIILERRRELFCEWGNRWYDLKRTGTIDALLSTKTGWNPTDALYPVPLSEIQRNSFLTQNPGY